MFLTLGHLQGSRVAFLEQLKVAKQGTCSTTELFTTIALP